MSAEIVSLRKEAENSAIQRCQMAIEQSANKDFVGFVGVLFVKGKYRIFSTRSISRHEMIGIMTEAIHDCCSDSWEAE